jgi:hypothetical protein
MSKYVSTEETRRRASEDMKRRYHERRNLALKLLGGKCVVCGTRKNLEIDHIDPSTKTMIVARMTTVAYERFLDEVSRCQLLCKKHHIEKTSSEQSVPHGGGKTGKRNCLCNLCAPLKREYNREFKSAKRGREGSVARKPPAERLKELHGTRKGYQIERRLGIPTCDECRYANSEYTRDLKARKAHEQQTI